MSERFIFVIDTEQYAGNFGRAMCAYCTGQIGDCEVGDNYAALYREAESEEFENIEQRPDDHACRRPCAIYPTKGWHNDGKGEHSRGEGKYAAYLSVAIFFHQRPTQAQIDIIRKRSITFNSVRDEFTEEITVTGWRIIKVIETEHETYREWIAK